MWKDVICSTSPRRSQDMGMPCPSFPLVPTGWNSALTMQMMTMHLEITKEQDRRHLGLWLTAWSTGALSPGNYYLREKCLCSLSHFKFNKTLSFIGSCFYGWLSLTELALQLNIITGALLRVGLVIWSLGQSVSVETGESKLFGVTILVKPHAISSRYSISVRWMKRC